MVYEYVGRGVGGSLTTILYLASTLHWHRIEGHPGWICFSNLSGGGGGVGPEDGYISCKNM